MARYHGKSGQIYMSATTAGAAVPVVGATGWTFDGSTDKTDGTSFGDTNKITLAGLRNAGGTFSFNWDDTETTLFAAAALGAPVKLYLYRDAALMPTHYRYGYAYVDISEDTNSTSTVSGSGTFSASAAWGRKP